MRVKFNGAVKNKMQMKLPALSANEGMARAAVAAFCAQLDPAAVELADVKCAVSEAVTNCIVHAYKERDGIIRIRCLSLRAVWQKLRSRITDAVSRMSRKQDSLCLQPMRQASEAEWALP